MLALLLTATVAPAKGVADVFVTDPRERLREYSATVTHLAKHLDPSEVQLVLAENSGSDVSSLLRASSARGHSMIHVPCAPDGAANARGKGAAEGLMINAAMTLITEQFGPTTTTMKLTGRLRVLNIASLMKPLPPKQFACRVSSQLNMVDTRLFSSHAGLWLNEFADASRLVDESQGKFFEHAVFLKMAESQFKGQAQWKRLPYEPIWRGRSGSVGTRYDGLRARIVRPAKSAVHRIPLPPYL